jgi:hypothetical protein
MSIALLSVTSRSTQVTRHVVKILRGRFAVLVVFRVGDHDRGAGGGKVNARTVELQVGFGVLPIEGQLAPTLAERVFDHRAWKAQPPVVAVGRAHGEAGFDAVLVGVGETDLFENAIHGSVDLLDIGIGKRFVLSARFAGAYRPEVFGERGLAQRNFCLAGIGTSCHRVFLRLPKRNVIRLHYNEAFSKQIPMDSNDYFL